MEVKTFVFYKNGIRESGGIPLLVMINALNKVELVNLYEENYSPYLNYSIQEELVSKGINITFFKAYVDGIVAAIEKLEWEKFLSITKLLNNNFFQWVDGVPEDTKKGEKNEKDSI